VWTACAAGDVAAALAAARTAWLRRRLPLGSAVRSAAASVGCPSSAVVDPTRRVLVLARVAGAPDGGAREQRDRGELGEALNVADRAEARVDHLAREGAVLGDRALAGAHREVADRRGEEGRGLRGEEDLDGEVELRGRLEGEEARPHEEAPEPAEVVPRAEHDHLVGERNVVADALDEREPQRERRLRHATLVNPEAPLAAAAQPRQV
jgi:hypothetical protein